MTGTPDINHTKDERNELLRVFRLFNMSDTGRIDHCELLLALQELGITSCLHSTRRILESIDLDKSGAIEFEDFCEFFAKARSEEEVRKLLTEEAVRCLQYKLTAESGDPNFARQYRIPSCQKPTTRFISHKDTVTGLGWVDANHFISTSLDGSVYEWNLLNEAAPLCSWKPLGDVSAPIYSHSLFPEATGNRHILGFGDGLGISLFDIDSGSSKWKSPLLQTDVMSVSCLDQNSIVAGTKDGKCVLFDIQGSCVTNLLIRDGQVIQSVRQISPSTIAVGFHSGFVHIVDTRSRATDAPKFEGCLSKLNSLTSMNNHIFTGGDDYIVRKFDMRNLGEDPEKFLGHSSPITSLQVAKKDQRLFSGSSDGSVRVWELSKPSAPVAASVKFQDSPGDASTLISASTRALIGHTQAVKCICVNESEPNGKIITGSIDTTINYYV